MKKHLVFAWNYLNWGGSQVYFFGIVKVARQEDWDVTVVLPRDSSPEVVKHLDELGINYRFVDHQIDSEPAQTIGRKIRRQLNRMNVEYGMFRELLKFGTKDRVFQIEIAPWQSVSFLTAMAVRGATVFIATHNFLPEDAPLWRRVLWKLRLLLVSRLPGLNIYVSNQHTKDAMRGWVSEDFWNRVRVAVTGVDPLQLTAAAEASFDRDGARGRHGINVEDFVVLCVGQFIDRKGRWIFLEAAEQILRDHDDVSFVWLMPTLPSSADRELVAQLNLRDKFRIVLSEDAGRNRNEVLTFFRVADAFALPSYVEGIPGAMLEAMSLAIPCISTNVYGIPEALKDRETGLLIPPDDSKALASAIMTLKNDEDLRSRLAVQGRAFVRENFDDRKTARIVLDEYTEALRRGR